MKCALTNTSGNHTRNSDNLFVELPSSVLAQVSVQRQLRSCGRNCANRVSPELPNSVNDPIFSGLRAVTRIDTAFAVIYCGCCCWCPTAVRTLPPGPVSLLVPARDLSALLVDRRFRTGSSSVWAAWMFCFILGLFLPCIGIVSTSCSVVCLGCCFGALVNLFCVTCALSANHFSPQSVAQ